MSSGDGTVGAGTGGMMDAEKGGESTQYESIQTVTKPHGKESGQMGGTWLLRTFNNRC